MTFNIGSVLSFLVAFQLLFVAIYLFSNQKGNKRNNKLLAVLFLLFSINLFDVTARISGIIFSAPLLHLMDDSFFFLYGPILFFYTKGVVYRDFAFRKSDASHLIPFVLFFSYFLVQFISIDQQTQEDFTEKVIEADAPAWVLIINLAFYVHILVYLFFSWQTIKVYQTVIKDKFSSIDKINLDWVKFMIRTFLGITIVAIANVILPVFHNQFFLYASLIVLLVISFYFISLVLVKALNQPAIFSGIAQEETQKYASSNLDDAEAERLKNELARLMETERLFLDPELKSKDLAEKLGVSPKLLSQVINQSFDMNFFDYINSYRCDEVKRILQGPDKKMTIIEAMYESGFNSKSSFNKEFKKLTGQTPSEYKKNLN